MYNFIFTNLCVEHFIGTYWTDRLLLLLLLLLLNRLVILVFSKRRWESDHFLACLLQTLILTQHGICVGLLGELGKLILLTEIQVDLIA